MPQHESSLLWKTWSHEQICDNCFIVLVTYLKIAVKWSVWILCEVEIYMLFFNKLVLLLVIEINSCCSHEWWLYSLHPSAEPIEKWKGNFLLCTVDVLLYKFSFSLLALHPCVGLGHLHAFLVWESLSSLAGDYTLYGLTLWPVHHGWRYQELMPPSA